MLPWRGVRNPYGTWLSEIMLQQTRVATVIERYSEFLRRFPTLADLAAAPEDDVLALWSGLGYYRRARMLHRGAQFVVRELDGVLPGNAVALRTLPGVGEYTAAAIASIAFGQSIAVLDGNVERVLLRLLGRPEDKAAAARAVLLRTANDLVPPAPTRRSRSSRTTPKTDPPMKAEPNPQADTQTSTPPNPPGDHNQAMMELGATICLPRAPLCLQCPVFAFCQTRGAHPTAARPALRSRHVAHLLTTRKRGVRTEVLLERRSATASLMPGMLELPPLPLEAAEGREPVLRLRHSITNTNYYVEVYAEGAPGVAPEAELLLDGEVAEGNVFATPAETNVAETANPNLATETDPASAAPGLLVAPALSAAPALFAAETNRRRALLAEAVGTVFEGEPGALGAHRSLRGEIPAAESDLLWCPTHRLYGEPLTGLARKALQRMGLMPMDAVRVKETGSL